MKPIRHLIILALALATTLASAQEPSLREQFKTAVDNYQAGITNGNTMANTKVMLKVIELYKQLEPPPAVPEEARERFVMGATVLKESKDATTAGKAVELFGNAIWLAPWWAEARYNRAFALEMSGYFDDAIYDLEIYLAFKLTEEDRRQAQDKIYTLKAKAELANTKKSEEQNAEADRKAKEAAAAVAKQKAAAAAEERKKNSIEGYWFPMTANYPTFQIVRVGQTLVVKPAIGWFGDETTITEMQVTETSLRITYRPLFNCHLLLIYELNNGDLVGTTTNLEMREKGSKNATTENRYIRKPWSAK